MSLKELAISAVVLSPIMEGREKLKMEDLVKYYPDGVTISEVDIIPDTKTGEMYSIFTFKEDDRKFASGGVVFNKIVNKWASAYQNDFGKIADKLAEEDIKVIFYYDKTSNKRDIVKCEIV